MRMEKMSAADVHDALSHLDNWKQSDEKWIEKRYRFKEFMDGISFVNEVASIAEEINHHPMIAIDYRVVTVRLTTWKAAGLTHLDMQSAKQYDEQYHHFN